MRIDVMSRHDRIVALLEERGAMRTAKLAEELDISPVTVRRDIAQLTADGRIARGHGKVMPRDEPGSKTRMAESPSTSPSFVVGVLVPQTTYYYGDVVRAIGSVIAGSGGRVVLGVSNGRVEEDGAQLRSLADGRVHGIIATPSWPDGTADDTDAGELLRTDLPTVLVERRGNLGSALESLDHVCTDHAYGARLAIAHLHDQGWRDMVAVLQPTPTSARLRIGFETAMAHHGLDVAKADVILSVTPEDDPAAGDQIAAVLEARLRSRGPFAALVHNDLNAMMIMQRLQGRGIRIPEDIGFVAYDDETADLADVPLTAVAPPKYDIGRVAAQLMLERLRQRRDSSERTTPRIHAELLPSLTVRESSCHTN